MNPTRTTASGSMTLITGPGRSAMSAEDVQRLQQMRRSEAQKSGRITRAA